MKVLRPVEPADIEVFYAHQIDPEARRRSGSSPRARDAFIAHWERLRADPTVTVMTIVGDGEVAGNVGSFLRLGKREVCYWLGREFWGRGLATCALAELLPMLEERPLWARVLKPNGASVRVLEKCGFRVVGEEPHEGAVELLLRLD